MHGLGVWRHPSMAFSSDMKVLSCVPVLLSKLGIRSSLIMSLSDLDTSMADSQMAPIHHIGYLARNVTMRLMVDQPHGIQYSLSQSYRRLCVQGVPGYCVPV